METDQELLEACVQSCWAMRTAFRRLVRRNVAAICEKRGVTDPGQVDRMVELTLQVIHTLTK